MATAQPRGSPCPLDADLCAAAARINTWVAAGDVAAVTEAMRGKSYTCVDPASDVGILNRREICAGAAAGDARRGFMHGEALLTEAEFRLRLAGVLTVLSLAENADSWGPPTPQVAAVSCFKRTESDGLLCDDRSLQVSVTLIGKFDGMGIPGQRSVYQMHLHRELGMLWIDGLGVSVPSVSNLYPFDIPAQLEGGPGTFSSRPWRP